MGEDERKRPAGYVELPKGAGYVRRAVCEGRYSVTVREVCQRLMCSRSFADRHLPGLANYIYVSRRYAKIVDPLGSFPGGRLYSKDSLDALVSRGAVLEARTAPAAAADMAPARAGEIARMVARASELADLLGDRKRGADARVALLGLKDALCEAVDGSVAPEWADAWDAAKGGQARGDLARWPWVEARPDVRPRKWGDLRGYRTIADLMDYGDTQEQWSRMIWRGSALRLTLSLGDAERVMYGSGLVLGGHGAWDDRTRLGDGLPFGLFLVPAASAPDGYLDGLGIGNWVELPGFGRC